MNPCLQHQVRSTLATNSQRYWKKFSADRASPGCHALHTRLYTGDTQNVPLAHVSGVVPSLLVFPRSGTRPHATADLGQARGTKFFWCRPFLLQSTITQNATRSLFPAPNYRAFAVQSSRRGTSRERRTEMPYLPQRGAKPAQARNRINGRGRLRREGCRFCRIRP